MFSATLRIATNSVSGSFVHENIHYRACRFIGFHLAKAYLEQGHEVFGMTVLTTITIHGSKNYGWIFYDRSKFQV